MVTCAAPWHSLLIRFNGDVVPDSQFQGRYGNIRENDLAQLWQSTAAQLARSAFAAGEWPAACAQCDLKEKSIGHSRRLFFRDIVEPILVESDHTAEAQPDIYYLEINSSNLCNLKCVMCNGNVSSAWIRDEQSLAQAPSLYKRPNATRMHVTQSGISWLPNLFKEPRHFRNLTYLALKGGEPFLDPLNIDICQFFIDQGLAHKITLDINTNGTLWNQELFDLFPHFKKAKVNVSVEATGELYRYIRGGDRFSFDEMEKLVLRLSQLESVEIIFVTLAMVYNIWNLGALRDWIESIQMPNHRATFKNIVVNPRYLDPHILPIEVRADAIAGALMTPSFREYEKRTYDTGYERTTASLSGETMDSDERQILLSQFKAYTNDLDRIRSTAVRNLVPALKPFL